MVTSDYDITTPTGTVEELHYAITMEASHAEDDGQLTYLTSVVLLHKISSAK